MNRGTGRRTGALGVVATVSMLLLSACGNVSENAMTHDAVTRVPEMSEAAAQATRDAASGAAAGTDAPAQPAGEVAEEVTVAMHDIFFEPTEITIPANTNVKFILPNEGAAVHNFAIPDQDISVDVAPGETKDVVLNLPAGEYAFDCDVPGHKEAGMVGTITVEEGAGGAAPAEGTPGASGTAPVEGTPAVVGEATPVAGGEATPVAAAAATPAEAAAPAAAEPVTIVSHDIYFDPNEMTIPANTDVTISLPNEGVTLHNFAIEELGINVDIQPGETQEVVINAPAGTYEYVCNVPGHKEAGMVGTLTVTEDSAAAAVADAPSAATAEQAAATPAPEAIPAAETAAPAAAAEPVTVVSYDIYFEPKEVSIPANTDVTFTLPNDGVTLHNFAIDELGISVDIQPGEAKEVIVNAPAGTYEYYCNVPGHKAAGMVGTLTVTESSGTAAADVAPEAATAEQAAATPAGEAAPAEEAAAPAAAEPVTVVSHDIYFDPKEFTIPADTDVTVSLPNEGVTLHNFAIDELGISVDIQPGATEETVINAPAGTYEYYCNVPGHKAAGMVGTLTIE